MVRADPKWEYGQDEMIFGMLICRATFAWSW
jgi:hypothetical protein